MSSRKAIEDEDLSQILSEARELRVIANAIRRDKKNHPVGSWQERQHGRLKKINQLLKESLVELELIAEDEKNLRESLRVQ